jgi:hypothetical protein
MGRDFEDRRPAARPDWSGGEKHRETPPENGASIMADRDRQTGRFLPGCRPGPGRPRRPRRPPGRPRKWPEVMPWTALALLCPDGLCPDDDPAVDALIEQWVAMAKAGHFGALKRLLEIADGPVD